MKNIEQVAELVLRQLDTAGYYLSRYGISNKVNRHTLIAIAMTQKERAKGELSRLELRYALQRKRIQHLLDQVDRSSEQVIELAPKPLADQLHKAKALVF